MDRNAKPSIGNQYIILIPKNNLHRCEHGHQREEIYRISRENGD